MNNKLGTLIGLIVLVAGAAGVYFLFRTGPSIESESEETAETVVPVKVGQIRRMTVHDYIRAYGTVVPDPGLDGHPPASISIKAPADGLISKVDCNIGTFVTRNYHAPFKLSADGEEIGLYRVDTPPVDTTPISKGSDWLYHDDGTDPGADWMLLSYDDTGWSSGPAELGYGDGDESTVVSYGPDADNKHPTTQFRKHFTIVDPGVVGDVRLRLLIDDSAVVYLKGDEISRIRMPDGDVSYQDYSGRTASTEGEF